MNSKFRVVVFTNHEFTIQFDCLENALGEPGRERATTRALEAIFETIDECERNGKRTEKQFKDWQRTVQRVELAVNATQRKRIRIL